MPTIGLIVIPNGEDANIIAMCCQAMDGIEMQVDTLDEDDAENTVILPMIETIVATQAKTLAGCAAKARLYVEFSREDIGASLAQDVIALAG